MEKNFEEWMGVKENIHFNGPRQLFREGEIWWIAAGKNVGVEINGKGPSYARPAIIFKKLSSLGCVVIPLTSQKHNGTWYEKFEFNKKTEYAVLAQIRVISVQRLYRRMGELSEYDYNRIANGVYKLFFNKNE